MRVADLPRVLAVADAVHPAFPEEAAVFEERLQLYPGGCLVFSNDEASLAMSSAIRGAPTIRRH